MTRKAQSAQPKGPAATERGSPVPKVQKPPPETFAEAYAALNAQRRKFVRAYLERPNATRAAKKAGYSEKNARTIGSELLTFLDIKLALQLGWKEAGAGPEEVLARTEEVMRSSIEDFYSFDQYVDHPYQWKPLTAIRQELLDEIAFEDEYAQRAQLDGDEYLEHLSRQGGRQRQVLRLDMELERDPKAQRWVPGPPVIRERERLDLVKARDLGVLHLAKSTKPSKFGMGIELEDRQHARDQIGKVHGLWRNEGGGDDETTGLMALVQHMAERKRQRDEERR